MLLAALLGLSAVASLPPASAARTIVVGQARSAVGPGTERAATRSDERRRAVFQDAARAQARARREAEATLPDADLTSPDAKLDRFQRRLEKRNELTGMLQEKYLRQVAARHGLSYEQVRGLLQEGQAKNWPVP